MIPHIIWAPKQISETSADRRFGRPRVVRVKFYSLDEVAHRSAVAQFVLAGVFGGRAVMDPRGGRSQMKVREVRCSPDVCECEVGHAVRLHQMKINGTVHGALQLTVFAANG